MSKMIKKLLVLCLNVMMTFAAPIQPSLQHLQQHLSPLQRQLLALQQMEMLNRLAANSPALVNPQPVLLLLPNFPDSQNINDVITNPSELSAKEYMKLKTPFDDKDNEDSVVVDANTENEEKLTNKAILLIPNRARLSLGDIISNIPWLPIEVNVPDTISWIYNGIAGIISGIGQRFPFNRPQNLQSGANNIRLLLKQHRKQEPVINVLPIVLVPIDAPITENN